MTPTVVAGIAMAMACGGITLTIFLFASGLIYARSTVDRVLQLHDEELKRAWMDADYCREAAQSCATTLAHREGQLRVAEALLRDRAREDDNGHNDPKE